MATTPNILLDLPTVSVTLGPEWATKLNTALTKIDSHDHSTDKGVKITPSGLNINADLTIGANNLTNIKSSRYADNATTLVSPADVRSLYTVNGNLYFNNGAGTPVQITNGTVIPVSSDGISRAYESTTMASNTVINPSDTFSYIDVDTTTSVQITLPSAAAVANGRFYVIKDTTGLASTNNITIALNGADTIDGTAASNVINANFGYRKLVSDGVSNWAIVAEKLRTTRLSVATTVFTSSGTWTKATLNPLFVEVIVVGGGGGSTGIPATTAFNDSAFGACGGGAGAAIKTIDASLLGATETVTVGLGGGAGAFNNNSSAGGTSSFGAFCSANGGGGTTSSGNVGGSGGTATGGDINIQGENGASAEYNGTSTAFIYIGTGGASYLSGRAVHRTPGSSANDIPGLDYGGGATGPIGRNSGASNGGPGGDGVVIVKEYYEI